MSKGARCARRNPRQGCGSAALPRHCRPRPGHERKSLASRSIGLATFSSKRSHTQATRPARVVAVAPRDPGIGHASAGNQGRARDVTPGPFVPVADGRASGFEGNCVIVGRFGTRPSRGVRRPRLPALLSGSWRSRPDRLVKPDHRVEDREELAAGGDQDGLRRPAHRIACLSAAPSGSRAGRRGGGWHRASASRHGCGRCRARWRGRARSPECPGCAPRRAA